MIQRSRVGVSIESVVKKVALGVLAVIVLLLSSCAFDRVKPDAGYEAVLVKQPILFGHGGVADTPVTTGAEWVAWTTTPVMVNMQPQQYVFSASDLMSSNGIPLHFDAAIRLQTTDSVSLIKTFGPEWYNNNIAVEFANRVRQAVRKHSMNELAIEADGIDRVDEEVTNGMNAYIKATKLPLRLIKVTVGKATPPEEVLAQRVLTAAAQQRQETERETKLAEDAREEAERSRAVADNAYRQTLNLSPDEFVQLQRINMQEKVCSQKDTSCTFIIGGDGKPVISRR